MADDTRQLPVLLSPGAATPPAGAARAWAGLRRHRAVLGKAVAAALAAGLVAAVVQLTVFGRPSYQLRIIFPDASNVVEGTSVLVNGAGAGSVQSMGVRSGKAVVVAALKAPFAPLHAGTTATIVYRALLGERMIDLTPGRASNPVLPSGAVVQGSDRVGLDQVLAALTPTVRAKLVQLVPQLDALVAGRAGQVQAALATAGPAVSALGQVLSGIGADSVTLRQLVTSVDKVVTQAVAQRQAIAQTVSGLATTMQAVAAHATQVQAAIRSLPATVDQATATFAQLPPTAAQVVPLLGALDPALSQLPALAGELRPVLQGLLPVTAQLPSVLGGLQQVLQVAPSLLSAAQAVVPGITSAVGGLQPVFNFLRPYTPELAGWLENWGSACANYDSNGNYCRIWVTGGPENVNALPAVVPPFNSVAPNRQPGALVGQPWTDAAGSPVR